MGVFNRELGAPMAEGFGYRVPTGLPIHDVVGPGAIVRTSYGSGPYLVARVAGPWAYQPPEGGRFDHWTLCLVDLREGKRRKGHDPVADSTVNEIVAVDGRLLKLFEVNLDEVLILERPAGLVIPTVQLALAL